MTIVGVALVAAGCMLLVVSAAGLFVLPDALARQHAATKAGTLALATLLAGVAIVGGTPGWWIRAGLTVVLLCMTLPLSSYALARAAAQEQYSRDELGRARPFPVE